MMTHLYSMQCMSITIKQKDNTVSNVPHNSTPASCQQSHSAAVCLPPATDSVTSSQHQCCQYLIQNIGLRLVSMYLHRYSLMTHCLLLCQTHNFHRLVATPFLFFRAKWYGNSPVGT